MIKLCYPDIATFVKVTSQGYSNNKNVEEQEDIPVIFTQGIGFQRSNFKDQRDSDAVCYPDPTNEFIINNHMRLEGMYILAPLFNVDDADGWFKVETCNVNRDHLLGNKIDNIELLLKKTRPIPGVS